MLQFWTLAGRYQWHPEALTATQEPPGGEPQTDPWTADVDPYQFAFAATNDATLIVVSPPHLDQGSPYGNYLDYYDKVE